LFVTARGMSVVIVFVPDFDGAVSLRIESQLDAFNRPQNTLTKTIPLSTDFRDS
jgi:hypothetical protein